MPIPKPWLSVEQFDIDILIELVSSHVATDGKPDFRGGFGLATSIFQE